MKHLLLILLIGFLWGCSLDDKPVDNRSAAMLHKDLFTVNHDLMNSLAKDELTEADSSYIKLCQYLDVVVLSLIEQSGGQRSEDGTLMNPHDTRLWIDGLEAIDFASNWKLVTNRLPHLDSTHEKKLGEEGISRVSNMIEQGMTLEWVCVELRILQYVVLERWVAFTKTNPNHS